VQCLPLRQTIIRQTECHVVAVNTNGKRDTAGKVVLIIHDVTSGNSRKTVFAGNGGINDRRTLDRIKRQLIGIGDNIEQIDQIFFAEFLVFIHYPRIGAFAAQAQPNLAGTVDRHFLNVVLIVPVGQRAQD